MISILIIDALVLIRQLLRVEQHLGTVTVRLEFRVGTGRIQRA